MPASGASRNCRSTKKSSRARKPVQEFEPPDDEPDDEVQRQRIMQRNFGAATRQTPLDRADDLGM